MCARVRLHVCVPVISLSSGCHHPSACCHTVIYRLLLYLLHHYHHHCSDFCQYVCLWVCVILNNSDVIDHPLGSSAEICERWIFIFLSVKRELYPWKHSWRIVTCKSKQWDSTSPKDLGGLFKDLKLALSHLASNVAINKVVCWHY